MVENFDEWNECKKRLDHAESVDAHVCREGEVWWCALGVNIGDEEDGKNEAFERPVLIFRIFNKRLAWIVPLTSKYKNGAYYYPFIHDGDGFAAILSQIRIVSTKRLYRRIYCMPSDCFRAIREKIRALI